MIRNGKLKRHIRVNNLCYDFPVLIFQNVTVSITISQKLQAVKTNVVNGTLPQTCENQDAREKCFTPIRSPM